MRAVALYATGSITLSTIEAAKTNTNNRLTFPALIPAISERERKYKTVRASAFCSKGWRLPTKSMYHLANKKISDKDFLDIFMQAKDVSKASRRNAKEADSDFDPDDSIMELGNGSEASSDVEIDAPSVREMHTVSAINEDDEDDEDTAAADDDENDDAKDDGDINLMVDHSGIFDENEDENEDEGEGEDEDE